MATDAELAALTAEMRNLINTLKSSSGMSSGGTFSRSGRGDVDDERVAKKLQKELSKSTNSYAAALLRQISGMKDLDAVRNRIQKGSLDRLREVEDQHQRGMISNEEAARQAEDLGYTFGDLGKTSAQLNDETRVLSDSFRKASESTSVGVKAIVGELARLAGAAAAIATPFIDVAKSAARFGTQIDFTTAALMGMSPDELNQLQADHRQIIQSSGMTLDNFNNTIRQGTSDLIKYTGSLRDATRLNAESLNLGKTLGVSQKEQLQFMADQQNRFKDLHGLLSMTAEQFMEMNQQLIRSSDVRSQLYRLSVEQRAVHMKEIQSTYRQLRVDGLLHDQALKVVEAFAAIGAESPMERMKKAAKMQAVMGAFGISGGARAAELYRGGLRGEGEQREFAAIQKDIQLAVGDRMSRGFASELQTSAILQAAGMEDLMGPNSKFADLNIQQTTAIREQTAQIVSMSNTTGKLIEINDQIRATLTGPIVQSLAKITTFLSIFGGSKLFGMLRGGASTLIGGAGTIASKVNPSFLGKGVTSIPGMGLGGMVGTAGVGLAAWGGYELGTKIYEANEEGISKLTDGVVNFFDDTLPTMLPSWLGGDDSNRPAMEKLADLADVEVQTISDTLSNTTRGEEYWKDHIDSLVKYMEQGKDLSDAMIQTLKDNNEWAKKTAENTNGTKRAIETQIEKEKQQAEEERRLADKGYRITWLRRAQT